MEFIPYGRQAIRQKDINSVVEVLTSDFLTQGPMVPRFEQALAAKCGVKKSVHLIQPQVLFMLLA